MTSTFRIARVRDIPIGVHWSWLAIFALVSASLAIGYLPGELAGSPAPMLWAIAIVTSLLFFGSVILHELGHTWVALRHGLRVTEITLFLFGGMAKLQREPKSARAELRVAAAGPIVSIALALVFYGLHLGTQGLTALSVPLLWLAWINLALGVFNLIPGFPLDGGRVLRAIVWRVTGDEKKARRVASVTGQGVAFLFIGFGIVQLFTGEPLRGIWWMFIGWFLQNAAAASTAQAEVQDILDAEPVSNAMAREWPRVSPSQTLDRFAQEQVLGNCSRFFVVTDAGIPFGTISLSDLSRFARDEWPRVTVRTAMTPWRDVHRVATDTTMLDALHLMDDRQVSHLPVEWRGMVVGVISRETVLRYVRLRLDLGWTEDGPASDQPQRKAA